MLYAQVHLTLPAWTHDLQLEPSYPSDDDKMALAIELSRLNVEHGTGGPFGAVVFDARDRVVSVGVNRVVPQSCSVAHGEMMAYMTAQQRTQRFRLNRDENDQPVGPITLATSGQPCCQCYGATVWAGIDRLLIAARSNDVEELAGFDEGPLPANWVGELENRGIEVVTDLQRDAAREVLQQYRDTVGVVY
jgi:tRNA(Arg) A34 adenosine deaminase TadA